MFRLLRSLSSQAHALEACDFTPAASPASSPPRETSVWRVEIGARRTVFLVGRVEAPEAHVFGYSLSGGSGSDHYYSLLRRRRRSMEKGGADFREPIASCIRVLLSPKTGQVDVVGKVYFHC